MAEYQVPRNSQQEAFPQIANCVQYFNYQFFKHIPEDIQCWIAGGAVRDYFATGKMTESDVDFFLPDKKNMVRLLIVLRNKFKFKHYLITKNAIKGYGFIGKDKIDLDIVKVPFENKLKTIDGFDFTVCCFAVDRKECVFHPSAPFDLLRKRLVINALPFPVSTLQRMQKYLKRDYWICNGGMVEIAKGMSTIDWKDPLQNNIEFYPEGSPRIVRID